MAKKKCPYGRDRRYKRRVKCRKRPKSGRRRRRR